MRALASFVMRGRSQAVMVVSVLGMLSLVMLPLSLLSSAAVALVTLRLGEREGILTVLVASLACGLLGLVALGSALPLVELGLLSWIPMWLLGALLRNTRSLSLTVQAGLVFGLAMIAVYQWLIPDPVAEWRHLLEPFREPLVSSQLVDEAGAGRLLASVARWMTGAVSAMFFMQLILSLFLGRWWQSLLYNPGGLGQEFQGLRAARLVGYLALGLLVLHFALGADWALVRYLLALLFALYFLQGLAVAHAMLGQAGASPGWLVGLYVLMVLALYYVAAALAATGFADTWLDFRARSRSRSGGAPGAGPNE